MNINVDVDVREVTRALDNLQRRQIPFATSKALNKIADEVQEAVRASLPRAFAQRRPDWQRKSIKRRREDFANKTRLSAVVRVEAPGDGSRTGILTQHEEGGTKRPKGRSLAIPRGVRSNKLGIVTKANRPRGFNFKPHGTSGRVMRGEKRTVLIRSLSGKGSIFRRKGKGKRSELHRLYSLVPQGKLTKRLGFHETARRVVKAKVRGHMEAALQEAIRTAKR